jgi:hypothetical protein
MNLHDLHREVIDVTDAKTSRSDEVNGDDVEAIQNDDTLTAADRVDLIANQVVAEEENGDARARRNTAAASAHWR